MSWYYNENGNAKTATLDEMIAKVKSGEVKRDTLVWNSELGNWCEAKDAPQLKQFFNDVPPPIPSPSVPPPMPPYAGNSNNASAGNDGNMVFSVLSYLHLWWIGFLTAGKDDPNVRFHMGQGIILSIFSAGGWIAVGIFSAILRAIFTVNTIFGMRVVSPWVVGFTGLLWFALSALVITFAILGIINASKGERKELPIIGKFAFYGKE